MSIGDEVRNTKPRRRNYGMGNSATVVFYVLCFFSIGSNSCVTNRKSMG